MDNMKELEKTVAEIVSVYGDAAIRGILDFANTFYPVSKRENRATKKER